MKEKSKTKSDNIPPYDMLWKEIISKLTFRFIEFFAPKLYSKIDTTVEPDFKEQEFHRLVATKLKGKKITDKLVKLKLTTGNEKYLLIHIEIQANKETDFNERMFQYFYRIIDKYDLKYNDVEVIAIFLKPDMDKTGSGVFKYEGEYTRLNFLFQIYNIFDTHTEEELLKNKNPFALVILASRYALRTKENSEQRLLFKNELIKLCIEWEYSIHEIKALFMFIEVLLQLNHDLEIEYKRDIKNYLNINDMEFQMTVPPDTVKFIDEVIEEVSRQRKMRNLLRSYKTVVKEKEEINREKEEINREKEEINREKEEINRKNKELKRASVCGLWKNRFPVVEIVDILHLKETEVNLILHKEGLI